jgi:hypothetical protein
MGIQMGRKCYRRRYAESYCQSRPQTIYIALSGNPIRISSGRNWFDLNGQNTNALIKSGNTTYPLYPVNGFVNTTAYDFDNYTIVDAAMITGNPDGL